MNDKKNEPKCSRCSGPIRWNTPARTKAGDYLCQTCAYEDRSGKLLIGIDQRTLEDNGTYYYSGASLRLGDPPTAWVEKGGRAVPLSSMELAILTDQANRDLVGIRDERHAAELVLKLIWLQDHLGMFRCTGCSNLFHKPIALRPLSTGALCKSCAERYQRDVRTSHLQPPETER